MSQVDSAGAFVADEQTHCEMSLAMLQSRLTTAARGGFTPGAGLWGAAHPGEPLPLEHARPGGSASSSLSELESRLLQSTRDADFERASSLLAETATVAGEAAAYAPCGALQHQHQGLSKQTNARRLRGPLTMSVLKVCQ